jgi:hypothetical protein
MGEMSKDKLENSKNKMPWWQWVLLIIGVIAVIALFIFTLGRWNLISSKDKGGNVKNDKEDAKQQHKVLKTELSKNIQLSDKLHRKFIWAYRAARIGLVMLWSCLMMVFYFLDYITNLSDFLTYTEASILGLVTLNFITFGTITNANDFINTIKIKVENRVYKKHVNLPAVIDVKVQELKKLEEIMENETMLIKQ